MTALADGSEPAAPAGAVVFTERHGRVLLITLNRPQARNAVNREVAEAVEAAIDELDRDPALGAAVISGNGPVFCAGMDLKAFVRGESPKTAKRGFAGLVALPPAKPLIAAVEGPAYGGGFEVVLACDLVVVSELAKFGLPEVRRGLIASGGGLIRLPRLIPRNRAMEVMLTGEPIDAEQAFALGLANRLVAPGQAVATALELARAIVANAPLALAAVKRVVLESPDWPHDSAFARQEAIADPVRKSNDAREGAIAFAEKRAPQWSGT
jgi:enoyl-CoA hydratase